MQDFFTVPDSNLPMSLRCFREELRARGWTKATLNKGAYNFITLTRPDGKVIPLYSLTPPTTNYVSGCLADDKLATYNILKSIDAPTPYTELLLKDPSERKAQLSRLFQTYPRLVVKPVDGAHGYDVFTNLTSVEDIEATLPATNHKTQRLVQEQLTPKTPEVRVICIDYKYTAAFARIPASVTGDGVHTIAELIKIENTTIRTAPYQSNLAFIDEAMSEEYLKKHDIADKIPAKGEKSQVVSICNVGCGGTIENLTDTFPEEKRALAEKIARAFSLPVVGIDFLDDYIIEINSTPSLHYPAPDDSSTICVKKFVDYLESLPA
ncbi:ATP-grasp domain-containing protein [Candidatus Saccharibacteria bacterium]|nr:ATP-grasp domain-containing protein [Candidatus Saccharibacteria bacterium]